MLDDDVDQRHVDLVHAGDAEQAQGSALGGVGRVGLDVLLDVVGDRRRGVPGPVDQLLVYIDASGHLTTFLPQAGTAGAAAVSPSGTRPDQLTTSKSGALSPQRLAQCVEEHLRLVRLRHPEGVDRDGQHAQRPLDLERDPAPAEERDRGGRQHQHGRVAYHDAKGAAGRQHAGEVLDEVPRESPADEQRLRTEPFDFTRDRDALADHRVDVQRRGRAALVHGHGPGRPLQPASTWASVAAETWGRVSMS